mmetsp:Transcript_29951/g.72341  ORF Transcript_29951/g.72341 Transcript_29951/m.72341 type:complete len:252 (+) Transcript_29951:788-1543(+)
MQRRRLMMRRGGCSRPRSGVVSPLGVDHHRLAYLTLPVLGHDGDASVRQAVALQRFHDFTIFVVAEHEVNVELQDHQRDLGIDVWHDPRLRQFPEIFHIDVLRVMFATIGINDQTQQFAIAIQLLRQHDPPEQFWRQPVNRTEVHGLPQVGGSDIDRPAQYLIQLVQVRIQQKIHRRGALNVIHHVQFSQFRQRTDPVPLSEIHKRHGVRGVDFQRTIGIVQKVEHCAHGVRSGLEHDSLVDVRVGWAIVN